MPFKKTGGPPDPLPPSSFCSGDPPLVLKYNTRHVRWDSRAKTFGTTIKVGGGQLSVAYQFAMSSPASTVPVTEEGVKMLAEAKYTTKLAKALAGLRSGEGLADSAGVSRGLGERAARVPRPLPVMDAATQMTLYERVWGSSHRRVHLRSEQELQSYSSSVRLAQHQTVGQPQVAAALAAAPPGFSSAPPGGAAQEGVDLLGELAQLRPGDPRDRWKRRGPSHNTGASQPKQSWKQQLMLGLGDTGMTKLMTELPGVSKEVATRVLTRGASRQFGCLTSPCQQRGLLQLAARIADDPAGHEMAAAGVPLLGVPLACGDNYSGVRIALFNDARTHDLSVRAKCASSCGPGLEIPDEVLIPEQVWQGCLKRSGLTDFARNKLGQLFRTSPATYTDALDLVKGRATDTSGLHLYCLMVLHIDLGGGESSQAGSKAGPSNLGREGSQPVFSAKTVAALPGGALPQSAHADYKATQEVMFGGCPTADLILQMAMDSTGLASHELKVCVVMTCPTGAKTYPELHEAELLTMLQLDNKATVNSRLDAFRLPSLHRKFHGGGDAGEGPDEATVEEEEEEDDGHCLGDTETLEAWDTVGEEPAPSPSGPKVKVRQACAVNLEASYVGLTRQVGGILTRARQHFSAGRNALARAVRVLLGSEVLSSDARKAAAAAQAASA